MAEIAKDTFQVDRRRYLWVEFTIVTLYFVAPGILGIFMPRDTIHNPLFYIYSAVYAAGQIGVIFFLVRTVDGDVGKIELSKPRWFFDLTLALASLVVFVLLLSLFQLMRTGSTALTDIVLAEKKAFVVPPHDAPLWLPLSFIWFLSATKEVIGRGYAVGRLLELTNPLTANITCSLLFSVSAITFGVGLWIMELLLSVVLCVAFWYSRRVWAGFVAHGIFYVYLVWVVYAAALGVQR